MNSVGIDVSKGKSMVAVLRKARQSRPAKSSRLMSYRGEATTANQRHVISATLHAGSFI
jgi:hypothetical protein